MTVPRFHPRGLVWLAVFFGLCLGVGLTCERKAEHLSEDEFAKIYTEIVVAAETQSTQGPGWERYLDEVFRKHRVSRQSFYATMDLYNKEPERWERVMERVIRELEARAGNESKPRPRVLKKPGSSK